ncbi:MAG: FkbM family methyltransferase [Planctomycetota bacterium]|nr:FkbM family methyltransferase [Planctomycetota bacterium]
MRLHEHDCYDVFAWLMDPSAPAVGIDVGAHYGEKSERFLRKFPRGTVYAFEPSPTALEPLRERAARVPGIRPVELAVGERSGEVELNLTADSMCSSVLPPSKAGLRTYPGRLDVQSRAKVPMVSLDEWTRHERIHRVDFLKIDVQGLELAVLRGASRLLREGVIAVNCEAQLVPEYEGASLFRDIDRFFADTGFTLYQIHEVWTVGEGQTSYLDAVWLSTQARGWIGHDANRAFEQGQREAMLAALREVATQPGHTGHARPRIALYGAGQHTQRLASTIESSEVELIAVLDDRAPGDSAARKSEPQRMLGVPILPAARATNLQLDAVILSSQGFEQQMWAATRWMRDAGIRVIAPYGSDSADSARASPVPAPEMSGAAAA